MVLVGHSMGGLLSKLQVTSSGQRIWNEFSTAPIERLKIEPEVRRKLMRAMFFEPSPSVRRVVFIGTPHKVVLSMEEHLLSREYRAVMADLIALAAAAVDDTAQAAAGAAAHIGF